MSQRRKMLLEKNFKLCKKEGLLFERIFSGNNNSKNVNAALLVVATEVRDLYVRWTANCTQQPSSISRTLSPGGYEDIMYFLSQNLGLRLQLFFCKCYLFYGH